MRDLISEMMDISSPSAVKRSGKRDLIAEMGGEIPRLPDVSGENSNPSWWEDQMKPTLMETGKQIFEIPKSLGEVGATAVTGAAGWLVGSGLGIAESLKPGSTRESVRAVAEDAAGRLTYQPRTEPAKILMEKAGRGIEAITGPAKEAAALPGESWNSPFLESVLKFAGEMATFEAMGAAGRIKPKVPDWYRMMTVKERGIVEGMKVDLANGEFTGAELRELWKDPANRAELLKRYQGVGKAERSAEPMRASGADVVGELPAGQGFEMRPRPGEVRDIIAEMGQEGPKALPPGQGFELRPRPDEVRDILAEMQGETKQIGLEPGTGEGFTSVPGTPEAPIVTKAGEPFKSEQTALRTKGLDWNLYEVTPTEGGGFAITRKLGREFKAKGEPPKMVLRGTEMVEAGQARDILTPEKQDLIIERRIRRQENEWISQQLANLEAEGIDAGATEASSGDVKADLIEAAKAEGYSEAEALDALDFPFGISTPKQFKTGTPVTFDFIHNTEKAPKMGERFGQDVEPAGRYIQEKPRTFKGEDYPNLEEGTATFSNPLVIDWGGGYQEATNWKRVLSKQYGDKKGKALSNVIRKSGHDGVITLDKNGNTSEIVDLRQTKGDVQPDLAPELSARETFSLSNPETEIGTLQPRGNATPTKGFDFGSERGSTGDLSESEILQAILKTRGKIEEAMPHIEALGRSVFESGKQTFLDWQAAIKTRLGDLWENFKGYLKGVWERLQSGAVGPMKNDRGSFSTKVKDEVKNVAEDVKQTADEYLGAISTRLGNIDPSLRNTLRKFEFSRGMESAKRTKQVLPFLEKVKKMSAADREVFDLARKNGNAPVLRTMVTKYGLGKEYHELRNVLAEMHKAAVDVGYDVGFQSNYHPRVLKDTKGFLRYFYKQNDWPILEKAIRAKEVELQRYLSDEEKAKLLNTMLRGYPSGTISLSKPGQLKAREIAKVTTDLNQFYMDSDGALLRYINDVTDAVEARKLFGKGPKGGKVGNLNDTIGSYVLDLLQKGKIKPEQEQVLKDILDARFNEVGTRGIFGLYKNLSYIDTMGSPISAITQIGDIAWALYKNGPLQTATATGRALTGKSLFKKEDIGIERIASEFGDTSKAARAVDKVFRLTGLTTIDNIGKESLINSAYNAARAKTLNPKKEAQLRAELEPIFEKETDQLIKDLKAGNITENVKLYLFNVLSDFQPISLSEMPQKYLTGGNGRIFYMLKTFTLKQFDIYRREIFQKIAKEGTRLEGIKNLVYLTSAFVAANAGSDFIKDFILGRPVNMEDKVVDNFLRLLGISKFVTWKAREEGVGSAMVRQIAPPFKAVDALSKDINKAGDEKGLEITQSIPVVGKLYYWWFGKGAEKSEKKAKAAGGGTLVNPKLKGLSTGQLKALK